jgi:hypothetical protein
VVIDGEELPPVTEQVEETLADELDMPGVSVEQEDGVMKVSDGDDLELALTPEKDKIVAAPEGATPGVKRMPSGHYVVITKAGLQITLSGAPKSFGLLSNVIGGAGTIQIRQNSVFQFQVGGQPIATVFNPFVRPAPAGMTVGVTMMGTVGTVVFSDGTMQMIYPAVPHIPSLSAAAEALFGGNFNFRPQADGTANVVYKGQHYKVVPEFELGESSDSAEPSMDELDVEPGEQVDVLNENGELVSQNVVAKVEVATEDGI